MSRTSTETPSPRCSLPAAADVEPPDPLAPWSVGGSAELLCNVLVEAGTTRSMNKGTQRPRYACLTALLAVTLLPACDTDGGDDSYDAELLELSEDDVDEEDRLAEAEADLAPSDLDSVEGDSPEPAAPALDLDLTLPTPGVADVTDPVKSCYWRKSSNATGTGAIVTCGGGYQILSGGCYNTTSGPSIYKNHPWENGSIGNLPEDGEWATDVDGANGWSCQKDSSSGTIITTGLCCKST